MSESQLYTSLDIGSSSVKVLIGEIVNETLHVIGVGNVQSEGIRRGTIIDIDATVESIKKAVGQAERMTGLTIREVIVGIPANSVELRNVRGVVAVNSENREIGDDDLDRVIQSSQALSIPVEREIVNVIPKEFIVDEYGNIKDPRGMLGVRLEMEGTLITTSKTILYNILRSVERAGLQVREIYLQPLAAGTFALTKDEKNHGTAYIDIGGGSTTVSVFKDGRFCATGVIPIGGDHVTKDLSIILKIPTEKARRILHQFGHAYLDEASSDEIFEIEIEGTGQTEQYSQHYLAEIISARMEELYEMILQQLYDLGIRDLPGGIVLTGGIMKVEGSLQLARDILKTRVRVHVPEYIGVREPNYSTAVGLIQYAHRDDLFYGEPELIEAQPPLQTAKPTVEESEQKPIEPKVGIATKAKRFFNNFFE